MSEDISNKVKKIVAEHLGIDESKVNEESSFIGFQSHVWFTYAAGALQVNCGYCCGETRGVFSGHVSN